VHLDGRESHGPCPQARLARRPDLRGGGRGRAADRGAPGTMMRDTRTSGTPLERLDPLEDLRCHRRGLRHGSRLR
jgi:hypothetical protein